MKGIPKSFHIYCYLLPLIIMLTLLLSSPFALAGTATHPFETDENFRLKIDNQEGRLTTPHMPRHLNSRPSKHLTTNDSRPQAGTLSADRLRSMQTGLKRVLGSKRVITDAQRKNLLKLTSDASNGKDARVVFDMDSGTPTVVKVKPFTKGLKQRSRGTVAQTEYHARQFLRENRQLLKLRDPDQELALVKSWSDHTGGCHYKYQQMAGDIPVYGKQLLVHTDGGDSVYLLNGRFEPTPRDVATVPEITRAEALDAVRNHLGVSDLGPTDDELVVFTRSDETMVLTYKIEVAPSLSEGWVYFIDAISGKFVHRMTRVRNSLESASGWDLNSSLQNFNTWFANDKYYLIDPSMPLAAEPYDDPVAALQSPGYTYVLTARNGQEDLYYITSVSRDSGWDTAGVSAMTNVKSVYDYYQDTFDRDGLDDNNRNFMSVVHLAENFANAFWNGTYVVFGDGDNTTFSNLAASLDITAHEIQHGITQFTANLAYENQSGALNEGYSDLFACMVDDDDWTVGEDITIPEPGYLRNLADPSQGLSELPSTMSEYVNKPNTEEGDWGGVHTNMSIASRAGYLMAAGLEDEGLGTSIGREKTARIWYRALTTYLTAYAQFLDGREAMIQAAEDLYGAESDEVAAVQAAWDAVGVSAGNSPDNGPKPGDVPSGDDIMIYLFPTDQTHDNPYDPEEHYNLYTLLDPAGGYNKDNDLGPLKTLGNPRYTKPAAYTDDEGNTKIFYATEENNLYSVIPNAADPSNSESSMVLDSGNIYSIALSPDGRYFAYTTPNPDDNHIYVLDLVEDRTAAIPIVSADDSEDDSTGFNTILYADSLAFDYTSKRLVFDALNCIPTESSSCSDGGGYRYWSIGFMHLANDPDDSEAVKGTLSFPFPNQDPAYDIAYPAFAANNSYVIAIDVLDYSDLSNIESMVWTMNSVDGLSQKVATPNLGSKDRGIYGAPTFWSQDNAITIQRLSDTNGSAYRVPIDENWAGPADEGFITGGEEAITQLNDYAVAMPVMHLPAARSVLGEITCSASSLNFDSIELGNSATKTLTLSNTSERDIRIVDIVLSRSTVFSHNGTNALLPRESQMEIDVTYTPTSAGSQSSTLTITSDADIPTDSISITATATDSSSDDSSSDDGDSSGSSGGGGGCMINTLMR